MPRNGLPGRTRGALPGNGRAPIRDRRLHPEAEEATWEEWRDGGASWRERLTPALLPAVPSETPSKSCRPRIRSGPRPGSEAVDRSPRFAWRARPRDRAARERRATARTGPAKRGAPRGTRALLAPGKIGRAPGRERV